MIGAPFHTNENDVQTGAVYIYTKNKSQWQYETTLFPDVEQTGIFGRRVAVSNGVIAIAAGNTVHVFEQKGSSWGLVSKLEPEDDDPRDQFGASLAVEGKYIAVGDPDFRDFGSVAIYKSQGKDWQFEERLFAFNSSVADGFGRDVSLSGNTLLGSSSLLNAGYVFERKGKSWDDSEILEPNDPLPAGFGFSVSLSGKTAVIGRPLTGSGAAYIFEKSQNSWTQAKKLMDPAGNDEDRLGQSVAIDNKLIAVGAPGLLTAPGKAYYAEKQGKNWSDLMPLEANGVQAGDQFGISMAYSGARGDDGAANNAGKVYVSE